MADFLWEVPVETLETAFGVLANAERCELVDQVLKALSPSDAQQLERWRVGRSCSGPQMYWVVTLCMAEAAHRRGGITPDTLREVAQDIIRGAPLSDVFDLRDTLVQIPAKKQAAG